MKSEHARFYDRVSPEYDKMTRTRERLPEESRRLEYWLQNYRVKRAVDAGCGSGLHSLALASAGVQVTGVDISDGMIEAARKNARDLNLPVDWKVGSFEALPDLLAEKTDAIFCLGNTLPHLLSEEDQKNSLTAFSKILKPGGLLLLQMLNYAKVLSHKQRIVAVNRVGTTEFIRFYDFLENGLQFNLLQIEEREGKLTHRLESTRLNPILLKDLEVILPACGFRIAAIYGNLDRAPFSEKDSPNLVVEAVVLP
ncbi:MAG: class I SAM-dependent methyltransferase [Calditrichia bacterium]